MPAGENTSHRVLYLVNHAPPFPKMVAATSAEHATGVRRAVAEAGPAGMIVLVYVHDPSQEDGLRKALTAGSFVGLKQVDEVAHAAWESAEAWGREALDEALATIVRADPGGMASPTITTHLEVARGPLLLVLRDLVARHRIDRVVTCRPPSRLLARIIAARDLRRLQHALGIPVIEVVLQDLE